MSDADEELISELVSRALELQDSADGEVDFAALCGDRADLVPEVRAAIETAGRLPVFQAGSASMGGPKIVGTLLQARYQVDERIGAGAMGIVYRATDLDLSREVAIKVLHLGLMDRDQAIARFEREAEALAAIRHESVVTIYDRGTTEDGAPFLVMELVDGVPLGTILERARARTAGSDDSRWLREEFGIERLAEPSFLRQSVRWAAGLASGLHAAHLAGVYHRDVKPSNVIVRRDGRVVLLDFGIAATESQATLTRTDASVGTPAYMAPEALMGNVKARPAQDVYGLTATLYHLLTLRAPYEGSPSQVLTALATREPALAVRLRPGLPKDIQAILDTGLARNAAKRYASAEALEGDLRAFLAYQPVSARRTTAIQRAARRLWRSKTARGAFAATALGLGWLGYEAWTQDREDAAATAYRAAELRVPANQFIVKYSNRVVALPEATEAIRAVLDRLVEADHDPATAHLLRAAFYLDHGDVPRAQTDMRVVANVAATDYARGWLASYLALPEDSSSAGDLEVPATEPADVALDHLLAGFHSMRQLRYADGAAWLSHDGLADHRYAQELLLVCDLASTSKIKDPVALELAAGDLHSRVIEFEGRFDGRSAGSAHVAAWALAAQERYDASLKICRDGLELMPYSSTTRINGARDAYRSARYDESMEHAVVAMELLPHYEKAFEAPPDVALARQQYDAARSWLERTPFPDSAKGRATRRSGLIQVGTDEALHHRLVTEDEEAAVEAAARTLELVEEQEDSATWRDQFYASICSAIVGGERSALFALLLDRQIGAPLDHNRLMTLLTVFPDRLTKDESSAVLRLLERTALELGRREWAKSGAAPRQD